MKFVSWSSKLLEEDGGGFCGGSKLACFAAFCMQMPSGADVATKAFRSRGGCKTYLENVIVEGCWQYIDKYHSVNVEDRCEWLFGSFCFSFNISAKLWIWPWTGLKNCLMVVPYLFFSFNAMWGTTCFRSCLGRTAKARDGTTARAAFRGWRSWCLFFLSRKRVKVSFTYYIITF